MDPKTYKGKWSGTQNGTYWAGAKLLAEVKYNADKAKKSSGKRKLGGGDGAAAKKAKTGAFLDNATAGAASSKKMSKADDALAFEARINAVEGVPDGVVYDTCPQVVAKIKKFLERDGMTKAVLLQALGNLNSNSLNRFLAGKKQDQCGNVTYKAGYVFFEKLRILEGQKKSAARTKNEREHPTGFSLTKSRGGKWVFGGW